MDWIIIIFLILQPFLDLIATSSFLSGIHVVIRGLFFSICLFYLFRYRRRDKLVILLTVMMFIYFCSYLFLYHYGFLEVVSYTLKLFYLPIVMMFFYYYDGKIDQKYICFTLFFYLLFLIICYICGFGNDVYEEAVKKVGFKGLFNSINEYSAIVVTLLPLVLNYLLKKKNYICSLGIVILVFIVSMLTGTKVILGGIVICLVYFVYKPFSQFFKVQSNGKRIAIITGVILIIGSGFFLVRNTTAYKNAIVQAKFFNIKNILSLEGVNKVIFNDRFSFIPDNQKDYNNSLWYEKLLGVRYSSSRKDVEIDLFDVFYKYGIIGLLIICFILIYYGYKSKLRGIYLLTFLLLLLISETSGHVLIYPAVCIYFGVIICFNKKKEDS